MRPIEIDATLKLAKRKLREGKVPEAEAMYRKVLAEQPECGEAVHFLGMAAARRGKLEEAAARVRKSIELSPEKAEYQNNLATVLGRMGRPIEALGAAQRALDIKGDLPEAWGNKGVALEALGRLAFCQVQAQVAQLVRSDSTPLTPGQSFSVAPDWVRCHCAFGAGMRASNPGRRCALPPA